jgi:tripartite-type tricarboxylate transporter receptor subunit TctC
MKAGRLRGLAVTSVARSDAAPELPSVSEFFPGYELSTWYGVGAPRDTPADIIGSSTPRSTQSSPTRR